MDVSLQDRQTQSSSPALAALDWAATACLLCAGRASELLIEGQDPLAGAAPNLGFRVVRCRDCGLCYTNPRPTPVSIGRFYPDDYSPYQVREPAFARRRWRTWPR